MAGAWARLRRGLGPVIAARWALGILACARTRVRIGTVCTFARRSVTTRAALAGRALRRGLAASRALRRELGRPILACHDCALRGAVALEAAARGVPRRTVRCVWPGWIGRPTPAVTGLTPCALRRVSTCAGRAGGCRVPVFSIAARLALGVRPLFLRRAGARLVVFPRPGASGRSPLRRCPWRTRFAGRWAGAARCPRYRWARRVVRTRGLARCRMIWPRRLA